MHNATAELERTGPSSIVSDVTASVDMTSTFIRRCSTTGYDGAGDGALDISSLEETGPAQTLDEGNGQLW